ncbi:hypothetical protein OEZ85_012183 [Tetradesmus obliquus]|uniref:RING-type domain-containing protein n=1 Tax=Tetradesmus obliquus TaxID=3088 RepID=A0ABY8TTA3_TETOB|nr:hypothetical protein OEZ85_012183 [Tetradesmus obliquus]
MPRISPLAKASATLAACAEAVSDANGLNSSTLSNLSSRMKSYSGFGEGVCTCARCMRRAGPIREDVENKLVQITYALANVYDDSPDLEVRVTDEHRACAEEMMACVESGDVTRLRDAFLEIEEQESEGLLEGGTATEVATYLIISAAQVGQPEVIRLLAEWDADMEETDSIRRGRPLMHAANNGHTAAVKALVDCGAEPEATDDNGYTALMVAVFSDRSSAAEALVDGGAAVDAQDRAGRTALSYAAMYGSTDCIYLLAARGADVAHLDADGATPLELAEGSGRQSAVDALKKLQLRVKMQEKRKVKQSKCRSGYSDLDAAQLQAKEQEAARAAAELLEQLDKEEAAKSAKAAKKKKKGKGKAAAADCTASDTTETPQQEAVADMLPPEPPANGVHHQQQHQATPGRQRQQQQQHSSSSHDSAATGAAWPAQELRDDSTPADPGDSAASKAADGKHQPRKQAKQAASTSPGGSSKQGADAAPSSSSHEQQQQQQQSLAHAATDDTASSVDEAAAGAAAAAAVDDELDVMRREWEVLLEAAARCKDQRQQPTMLARVADMLPRCSDAGISVKYGRKVLQRLQAVGPARTALQAALAAQPCSCDELEAALSACKSCRCLLEEDLLQVAEDASVRMQQAQQMQQQQQQLAGSYWGAPRPSLVTPGGFGSVGQPLSRSPAGGGRLSLDMLAPSPGLAGASLAAAAGDFVRRSSLSTPVAGEAPVLLSGQAEVDVLDDHQHPAYAMANALLSDDDDDQLPVGSAVVECRLCFKGRADTCCLPCGCLQMCQGCALLWKQRGEQACPWCKAPLEDYAVV